MENRHIKILNVLLSFKHREAQREGIHQSPNQMPHLPHLKFKLDPLAYLVESPFCGPRISAHALPLDGELAFYFEKNGFIV